MKALNYFNRTPSINEYMQHRIRVIDRKREIEKIKLDSENGLYDEDEPGRQYLPQSYKGTHRIKKEEMKRYKKIMWYAVFTLPILMVLYIFIITILGL